MTEAEFTRKGRIAVFNLVRSSLDPSDHKTFALDEVYFVWFVCVLGNFKGLVSTTLPDGMYYEVVYNSAKDEFYIVSYRRWQQLTIGAEYIDDQERQDVSRTT